jgi:hypothetical protein
MLVGRKGKEVEPGYIFVPYVMAQSITTIQHKYYFRKSKIRRLLGMPSADSMIKSRYATKKVNNNFYKTIDIKKPLN